MKSRVRPGLRAIVITTFLLLLAFPISVAAQAAPHLVVNTHRLNIRGGPGVGYSILTSVPGGTELPVVSMDIGGLWYEIEGPTGRGWVNSYYAVGRGDFSRVQQSGTPDVILTPGQPHLVVNTHRLNVRNGPGVGYSILTSVRGGTKLPVVAIHRDNLWYQVESVAGVGWVNSYYTVTRGNFSSLRRAQIPAADPGLTGATPRVVVNTQRLNIRSAPGSWSSIITSVPGGTTLAVKGISRGRYWFLVEGSFGEGWVNNAYTVFRGNIRLVPTAS